MKEFIKTMARALVDEPGEVSVNEICGAQTMIFELTVTKSDIGKVIGKKGKTAAALRTLLSAVSAKNKKKAVLEIMD
ncbi:MAG: KH domain-containing protein [Desulfobacteraceae bacterium]|nr:MAG: KH domain-containing protein [Desulfobacteraceae bacterium]